MNSEKKKKIEVLKSIENQDEQSYETYIKVTYKLIEI